LSSKRENTHKEQVLHERSASAGTQHWPANNPRLHMHHEIDRGAAVSIGDHHEPRPAARNCKKYAEAEAADLRVSSKEYKHFLDRRFPHYKRLHGESQFIEAVVKATDHNRKRIALVNKLVLQVVRLCGKLDTPMTRIIPCQKSPSLSPVAHFLVMPSPLSDKNARMAERLPSIPRSHNLWGISL